MMIAMLLPRFAVVFSIIEFVRRGRLFLFESVCVLAVVCVYMLLLMVRCEGVLNVLRLLTELR